LHGALVHRLAGTLTRKEPPGRPGGPPPGAQLHEQRWREHDIAIPVPRAVPDVQDHPPTIDVANLEVQRFADPQPGRVAGGQDDAVLLIHHRTEKAHHLLGAEHDGQRVMPLRRRDGIHRPGLLKRRLIEEPQRGDRAGDRGRRQLSLIDQIQLVGSNLLRAHALRRLPAIPGKPCEMVDVRRLRLGR